MKKTLLAVSLLLGAYSEAVASYGWIYAETEKDKPTIREMFKETEGKFIDWAIASSVEPVYYNDILNGNSSVGGQFPIVYVKGIVSCDFGYVAPFEDKDRGSLAVGGSLRLNKILEQLFPDQMKTVKGFLPQRDLIFDRLFFGPFVSHSFVGGTLRAGIKFGLKF